MKKKMMMVLLAAVLSVSAGACGKEKQNDNQAGTQTDDKQTEALDNEENATAKADQVSYDVKKCVTLGKYSGLQVSLPNDYKVTKEQVDDYALGMAQYNAQPVYKDTDKKKVEEGDTVNIDYEGKKDGVAFEGGTASGYNLTIGSHSFIDGFEEGLVGVKVGQTVDLDLSFPENYPSADLAGAAVVFTVKVNKIVVEDPDAKFELNDEFVRQNYDCETVEEYKEKVKSYLKEENKTNKEKDTRQEVINILLENSKVTIPDELMEARLEDSILIFTNRNCTDGTTLKDFLATNYNGMTEEDFRSDIANEVKTNLQTELILEAIAQEEGVKLEEEAFQDYVQQQMEANGYASAEDFYKANGVTAKSGETYERKVFVCNRALDLVIENAEVRYGVAPDGEEQS